MFQGKIINKVAIIFDTVHVLYFQVEFVNNNNNNNNDDDNNNNNNNNKFLSSDAKGNSSLIRGSIKKQLFL